MTRQPGSFSTEEPNDPAFGFDQAGLALMTPAEPTVEDTQLALALAGIPARDEAWIELEQALATEGRSCVLIDHYLWVARHCPQDRTACAPWLLFGWAAWRTGHAMQAQAAVDAIRGIDPTYTAADLLEHALSTCIDPRQVPVITIPPATTGTNRPPTS